MKGLSFKRLGGMTLGTVETTLVVDVVAMEAGECSVSMLRLTWRG